MRLSAAAVALGFAALLVAPRRVAAFSMLGHALGLDQRDVRVFNNFADPEANDNTTPHATWPGALGAPMAVWKAVAEWGSRLHGDGEGDPSQPGDVGSGGASFDVTWQALAPGPGGPGGNVVSAIASCGGGVIAFTELGSSGWRIRLCDDWLWDDGPGTQLAPGALDIQGVVAHEFGHALGLGHSTVPGSTMYPALGGSGVEARSIETDDAAGLVAVYGAVPPGKPRIDLALSAGTHLTLLGAGFAPAGNEVWFTEAGLNASGEPLKATGVVATDGGTRIELTLPPGAGPGDVLVRLPGTGGAALSNAFPLDAGGCTPPLAYCTAQTGAAGCTATIGSGGTPSASAGAGFAIRAQGVRNHVFGLLFYGKTGPVAVPFGGGWLCAQPPLVRTQARSSGGTPPPAIDCSGSFVLDFNAWIASGSDPALGSGQEVFCQWWSRDPDAQPPGSTLTDALGFVVCP